MCTTTFTNTLIMCGIIMYVTLCTLTQSLIRLCDFFANFNICCIIYAEKGWKTQYEMTKKHCIHGSYCNNKSTCLGTYLTCSFPDPRYRRSEKCKLFIIPQADPPRPFASVSRHDHALDLICLQVTCPEFELVA